VGQLSCNSDCRLKGKRFFLTRQRPDQQWSPPGLLSEGQGLFPRGQTWTGREADRLLQSSGEVKSGGAVPPLLHVSYVCGEVLN
jgi:hypothetical protein